MTKILVAGDFRHNSGSSHVIYNYHKMAGNFGYGLAVSATLGSLDKEIPKHIPVRDSLQWGNYLVLVFESNQYLSPQQVEQIQRHFDRDQIVIVDPDGRSCPTIDFDGDSNHSEVTLAVWQELFTNLSNKIIVPKLRDRPENTLFHPYFGMEYLHDPIPNENKKYSAQYIGSNWYRWEAVKKFIDGIAPLRGTVISRVALKGKWWDGEPRRGFEFATTSDYEYLRNNQIEVMGSVPFGQVISSMSESEISPIFVRPMIAAQYLITPRMFETLCSFSLPIFHEDISYIQELYGENSSRLCYSDAASEISAIMTNLTEYYQLVDEIKKRLFMEYNYHILFKKLL